MSSLVVQELRGALVIFFLEYDGRTAFAYRLRDNFYKKVIWDFYVFLGQKGVRLVVQTECIGISVFWVFFGCLFGLICAKRTLGASIGVLVGFNCFF